MFEEHHIQRYHAERPRSRAVLAVFLAFLATAGLACSKSEAAAGSNQQQASNLDEIDLLGFELTNQYKLIVGHDEDPNAEIWQLRNPASILVVSEKLPTSVLLRVESRRVSTVAKDGLAPGDGVMSVPAAAIGETITRFVPSQGEVAFSWRGTMTRLVLDVPEPLVGEKTRAELFEHSPDYQTKAKAYRSEAALLQRFQDAPGKKRVLAVFATWCGVCKTFLPNLIRVSQDLDGSGIDFDWLGIPDWNYPKVKELNVNSLPTAIVYVDGKEVGRFSGGKAFDRIERSLVDALSGGGAPSGGQ